LRRRYIGFCIKKPNKNFIITRNNLINEIKKNCDNLFNQNLSELGIYLIRFDGNKGIIKCNHISKERTIKILKSIKKVSSNNIEIITLGTSGTIKGLVKKHMYKGVIFNIRK